MCEKNMQTQMFASGKKHMNERSARALDAVFCKCESMSVGSYVQ